MLSSRKFDLGSLKLSTLFFDREPPSKPKQTATMVSHEAKKIPRFLPLYCLLILCYIYNNAVTVKMLSARAHWGQSSSLKRPLHSKRQKESKVDIKDDAKALIGRFVSKFEEIITSKADNNQTAKFAAIVLMQGKVYCRASQKEHLSRGRYFVQMLQRGLLDEQAQASASYLKYDLPILLKHDDSSGCHPATRTDAYRFPRLTWAVPVNNTSNEWCNVVGVPSYKAWKSLKQRRTWETVFKRNEKLYPWSKKVKKAVWRGSTTSNKGMYGQLELLETPRGMLVKNGVNNSLLDVGFHKVVGKYENTPIDPNLLKDPIPLEKMMNNKAIIDIDGNNWSARFHTLLCYNSVIIKIAPDFVEASFKGLIPGVHYLPSTIDNITQVAEFVMDRDNDAKMQQIVANANTWCKENMIKRKMARSAIDAIEEYRVMLNGYDKHWQEDWHNRKVYDGIDDLVECNII